MQAGGLRLSNLSQEMKQRAIFLRPHDWLVGALRGNFWGPHRDDFVYTPITETLVQPELERRSAVSSSKPPIAEFKITGGNVRVYRTSADVPSEIWRQVLSGQCHQYPGGLPVPEGVRGAEHGGGVGHRVGALPDRLCRHRDPAHRPAQVGAL